MIATKTLLLMVMGFAGRENGGKAKNCRVLARYIGILKKPDALAGYSVRKYQTTIQEAAMIRFFVI